MTIRIWHQSFTVLSDLGAYNDALVQHFKRVSRSDTQIVMHGMRAGTYRSNYPGDDIRHVGMQLLHSVQFVRAAVKAERNGLDAYAISSLPDPALRESFTKRGLNLIVDSARRGKLIKGAHIQDE